MGAAEDILQKFTDKSFDLFTMAVLEHIHPSSINVFDNIVRISKRVLAVEPSKFHISVHQFPHDIPALFEGRGF